MISYKKLKEIRPEDIGRDNDRCYNCPTKIVWLSSTKQLKKANWDADDRTSAEPFYLLLQ